MKKFVRVSKKDCGLILPEFQSCAAPALAGIFDIDEVSHWTSYVIPPYNQGNLGSCVGHATANYVEAVLRKLLGKSVFRAPMQINSEAIYHKGREMFWKGHSSEGLLLHQGFQAAQALGIVPPGKIRDVSLDLLSISHQLHDTPLVMGQMIHRGWNSASKDNGLIKWSNAKLGGHAILMTGILRQEGQVYVQFLNSWGRDWGYGGTGLVNEHDYLRGQYTRCLWVDVDDETWKRHEGWRNFVIRKQA